MSKALHWSLTFVGLIFCSGILFLPTILNGSAFYYSDSGFYLLHDPGQVVDSALLWRPIIYNWAIRIPVLIVGGLSQFMASIGLEPLSMSLRSFASVQFSIFCQCLVVNMVMWGFARSLFSNYRVWQHALVVSALMLFSPLGLYANYVMTDIYAGLLVLSVILVFNAENLKTRVALFAVSSAFAVVHFSHILAVASGSFFLSIKRVSWRPLVWALIVFELGLLAIGTFNYIGKGRFQISNTAGIYVFSKLYSLGIAQSHLNQICSRPDERASYRMCEPYLANPEFHIWGLKQGFAESLGGLQYVNRELALVSYDILTGPLVFDYMFLGAGSVLRQLSWVEVPLKPETKNPYLEKELSYVSASTLEQFKNQKIAGLAERGFFANWGEVMALCFGLCLLFVIMSMKNGATFMTPKWRTAYWVTAAMYLGNGLVVGLLTEPESRYSNRLIWVLMFLVLLQLFANLPQIRQSWLNDNEQRPSL